MEVFKFCNIVVFLQLSGGLNPSNGEEVGVTSEGELVEKHGRPVLDVSIQSWTRILAQDPND